jgi:hypothetical protein
MGKLFLALIAFFAALLLASVIASNLNTGPRYDPVEAARQEAEIARYEAQIATARTLEPLDLALAAAWRLLPLAVVLAAFVWVGAWGCAALIRFRHERVPDARGLLPVERRQLGSVAPAALAAFHTARQLEAERPIVPTVPHSLSYAPHTVAHHRADALGIADAPALELPAPGVPTFAGLLDGGRIGRGPDGRAQALLLGVDAATGAELAGDWKDLYSTVVAGFPGSGKTTTQRFLAAQTALHGARFVVIDPHAEAGDDSLAATLAPLASCYLCEPASDDKRILEAVKLVADIGDRRVKGKDTDLTPVILWADELTKLLGRSAIGDKLAELLEAIAQEYRKKNVFVCGSGQIWTAERTTSELRDSFASVIAHRMKRGQARLLLPTDEAAQVERLETGHAILWRTSGETTTVVIPNTTRADVVRVAGLLEGNAPTMPRVARPGPDVYPGSTQTPVGYTSATRPLHVENTSASDVYAASERATAPLAPPDAQTARILAQFAGGASLHDLAAELAGTKNTNSSAYRTARQQVEAVLRGLAQGK